jgi:secreted trypsin-like serine protease
LGIYTRLAYYHEWIKSVLISKTLTSFTLVTNTNSVTNRAITYECDVYKVSCGCSAENVELSPTRIIGGEEAIPFSWTMTVSIRLHDSEEHSCGGTILTGFYILTSAHCVDGVPVVEISIVAGVHNRYEDFQTIRYVHDVYMHPHWNGSDGTFRNDIALLYIFPPLFVGSNGQIALTCVPYASSVNETVSDPQNGSQLVIIGWGSTQYGSNNMSDTLQQASIYMIDSNDPNCQQSIHDVETQFCAGMYGGGNEYCLC